MIGYYCDFTNSLNLKNNNQNTILSVNRRETFISDNFFLEGHKTRNGTIYLPRRRNIFDPINYCKSAGVIPYTIHQGEVYFLLQKMINPLKKKDNGWNDFGGKRSSINESTAETAAREFSEETNCLFYLKSHQEDDKYQQFSNKPDLSYPEEVIRDIISTIDKSQSYYRDLIHLKPIHVSCKEVYISYLVQVPYIPSSDIPMAEDIHIPYEDRYLRECKWFSASELLALPNYYFHKRLQITNLKRQISHYLKNGTIA